MVWLMIMAHLNIIFLSSLSRSQWIYLFFIFTEAKKHTRTHTCTRIYFCRNCVFHLFQIKISTTVKRPVAKTLTIVSFRNEVQIMRHDLYTHAPPVQVHSKSILCNVFCFNQHCIHILPASLLNWRFLMRFQKTPFDVVGYAKNM